MNKIGNLRQETYTGEAFARKKSGHDNQMIYNGRRPIIYYLVEKHFSENIHAYKLKNGLTLLSLYKRFLLYH